MKKKIAIIGGGYSSESGISMKSTYQLMEMMDSALYDLFPVCITKTAWTAQVGNKHYPISKEDFSFDMEGTKITFDCVYNSIHGTPGEDGRLPAYFELIGLPYTSCGVFTGALTFNKFATKKFLEAFDIHTAKALLVRKNDTIDACKIIAQLSLPCFVKPNNGGSSFGVSKVKHESELLPAITLALHEDDEVIIESFVQGIEISNGVYKVNNTVSVLPITEIQTDNEFFDYNAKYEGKSREITPAQLSEELTAECKALTAKIYTALDCKGVCRVDYIIANNTLYFLEINTVPGMSKASIIPQQIRAAGMKEADVFTALIEEAMK
ncbi:MAG: D-alanine--D-alanine ligase [Bacteroidales bacterium]|jgi:D-alanine-D-alanine ligase|nr:D-alanine--D-alanine ligase [Bacteroidales bacterium]